MRTVWWKHLLIENEIHNRNLPCISILMLTRQKPLVIPREIWIIRIPCEVNIPERGETKWQWRIWIIFKIVLQWQFLANEEIDVHFEILQTHRSDFEGALAHWPDSRWLRPQQTIAIARSHFSETADSTEPVWSSPSKIFVRRKLATEWLKEIFMSRRTRYYSKKRSLARAFRKYF